jgi:hypothetical protein
MKTKPINQLVLGTLRAKARALGYVDRYLPYGFDCESASAYMLVRVSDGEPVGVYANQDELRTALVSLLETAQEVAA